MKRLIIAVLALMMIAGLAAGCSGGGGSTPAPADSADSSAPDTRPVITLTISNADETSVFDPGKDELAKLIEDRFRIRFDPKPVSDATDFVLLAASDDLPDVMYFEPLYAVKQCIDFIEQEYVKDIPQALIDKHPNIKNIIETSDLCVALKELYDGNWMLPKPDSMDRNLYVAERRGIFYRKDWAEKVGITERPTNTEDFYEMCRRFTFDDPDGNGKNDTWGFTTPKGGEMRIWFISWGVDNQNWVKAPDGTWTHGMLLDANIEPLEYFRMMYQEGIMDPEFAAIDYVQAMQKLAGGTVGAITRNADTDWINNVIVEQFGSANSGDPFEMVDLIPIMSKDANSQPYMQKYIFDMTGTNFNADLSDDALDRYLAFHEWCMTDEGVSYKLGFEGKDWKKDANGNYEIIPLADGTLPAVSDLYPSIGLLNMPSWGFELHSDYKWPIEKYGTYANQVRDLSTEARALRNPNAVPSDVRVRMISTPGKADAEVFAFSNEVVNIVMGTEPVEKMFQDMVNKAMDSGFRQAIQEVNAYAQEHGIN